MTIKSVFILILLETSIETKLVVRPQLLTSTSNLDSTPESLTTFVNQTVSESKTNQSFDENIAQPLVNITSSITVQQNNSTADNIVYICTTVHPSNRIKNITTPVTRTTKKRKMYKKKIPELYIILISMELLIIIALIVCWILTGYCQKDMDVSSHTDQADPDHILSTDSPDRKSLSMSYKLSPKSEDNRPQYSTSPKQVSDKTIAKQIDLTKLKATENPTVPEKPMPTTDRIIKSNSKTDYLKLRGSDSSTSIGSGLTIEEEKRLKYEKELKSTAVLNDEPPDIFKIEAVI